MGEYNMKSSSFTQPTIAPSSVNSDSYGVLMGEYNVKSNSVTQPTIQEVRQRWTHPNG